MTRKQEDLSNFNLLLKKAITEDETSNAAYSCIENYQKAVEFGLGIRKKYDDNTYHEVTRSHREKIDFLRALIGVFW